MSNTDAQLELCYERTEEDSDGVEIDETQIIEDDDASFFERHPGFPRWINPLNRSRYMADAYAHQMRQPRDAWDNSVD